MNFSLDGIKAKIAELAGVKDSTHAIAGGVGLGLFLGVLPGTGALAALAMAWLLRVNKAAALAGALLVNTWINFVAFPLALVFGSFLTGTDPAVLTDAWVNLFKAFSWEKLLDVALLKTLLALGGGFVLIGVILGLAGYGLAYAVVDRHRKNLASKVNSQHINQ
jgi:uncharacterized protein (DUF2062 family)